VQAVQERGISKSDAARLFSISLSSIKRYTTLADRGESLTPKKGGGRPPIADETTRKLLEEDVRTRPSATVRERRHFLESFAGKTLSEPTLRGLLKRMGFSRKKDCGALERDEWLRAAWKVMVAQSLDARSVVFVDEMGTNISLSPLYAWSRKGERANCSVPRNRGKNTMLLASMSVEGMGPSLAVEGATNSEVFETYVERVLAPALRRDQVVMDNQSAHKGERFRELIEWRGCELLYLPPYSLDLNP
jgi:transposase